MFGNWPKFNEKLIVDNKESTAPIMFKPHTRNPVQDGVSSRMGKQNWKKKDFLFLQRNTSLNKIFWTKYVLVFRCKNAVFFNGRFSGVVPRSFEKKLAKKGSDTYFYGGDMFSISG